MAAAAADSSFLEDIVLDEADDHDLDTLFQAGDISEFADDVAPAPAAAPAEEPGNADGPVFTYQDEEREIASLTMHEIVRVNADLLGVTPYGSRRGGVGKAAAASEDGNGTPTTRLHRSGSFASQSTASTTHDPESTLGRLELALKMMPADRVSAYRRAEVDCPDQVTGERKMAFVHREDGNVALAAARLARYWQFRLDAFGEDRCFQPLTLAGAMIDEVVPMMNHRIFNVLPVTDTAGRAIVFVDITKRDYAIYNEKQEIRVYLYILETIVQDRRLCRRGITFLSTGKHSEKKHFSRRFAQLRREAENCSPIHVRAVHLCHPSTIMNYVIYPMMKYFMPQDFRLRFRLHNGSEEEVLRALEGYCLPRDRVPTELGGDIILDMNQWVLDRMTIESARMSTPVLPAAVIAAPASAMAESSATQSSQKRRRKNDGEKDGSRTKPPAKSSTKLAAASAKAGETTSKKENNGRATPSRRKKQKKGTPGRPSDPRMLKAVQAKMENPSLPLEFVLEKAGFIFHENPESGVIVDQDGIACKQRKNQCKLHVLRFFFMDDFFCDCSFLPDRDCEIFITSVHVLLRANLMLLSLPSFFSQCAAEFAKKRKS